MWTSTPGEPRPEPRSAEWVLHHGRLHLRGLCWSGSTSQAPFLLVHGLASNCRTWEGVGRRLASEGHRVVAVDLRGHGLSDKPDQGYYFSALGHDLAALLDDLGWASPVVVGQSMGANLVLELAGRRQVRAAAGVDGGMIDLRARWPRWEDCEANLAPPVLQGTPAGQVEQHLRDAHPHWSDEGVAATMSNLEILADGTVRARLARAHHMALLRAMWSQRPHHTLARVDAPVMLVLAGSPTESQSRAEGARLALRSRPDVRLHWMAGEHDLHVGHSEEVADLLVTLA